MLLTRKSEQVPAAGPRLRRLAGVPLPTLDRRTFLKRSGLVAGAGAFASQLPYGAIGKAEAAKEGAGAATEVKRTVCTHCSVGCAVDAIVENGVWTRQEPVFDSPLNLGAHCAKGASVREHGMHEHSMRLKTPMKLVNGKYQKISWEPAINEIGDKMLALRKESGPDAVFWVGSSKHNNEQSYLVPQVRVVLGHEQHRPPGADLPLDHGRRRRQHLGLRRDDQLVQRHAEHQVRAVHRQQRRRGAPGVDAAHAARQGDRREDDRRRPALHAHRGEGRRVRAAALRHGHSVPVRRLLPHLQERLGGQEVPATTASTAWRRSRRRSSPSGRPTRSRRPAACPRRRSPRSPR